MEKKKGLYEKPLLENLNVVAQGEANDCTPGSGANGNCMPGGSAHGQCVTGGNYT